MKCKMIYIHITNSMKDPKIKWARTWIFINIHTKIPLSNIQLNKK